MTAQIEPGGAVESDAADDTRQIAADYSRRELIRHCDVCGRPLPAPTGKRGRRRERHKICVTVMARISELRTLVPQIRFMPPATQPGSNGLLGKAKDMRRELHSLSRLLTTNTVKTATDDRDYGDHK